MGERAHVTYARGDDKNTDEPEYQTQWSFSGGYVYPKNPAWQKASFEGNPLAAPLRKGKLNFKQTSINSKKLKS